MEEKFSVESFLDHAYSEDSEVALEAKLPQNPSQNLKSKIESLCNSIENLSKKQVRIEFEIRRQKKALARKREELKKVSRSQQVSLKLSLESTTDPNFQEKSREDIKELQLLLSRSARILEE